MQVLPSTSKMIPKTEVPLPGSQPFGIVGLTHYVAQNTRLVFLRYFDGEFHSMFGTSKRGRANADGHQWMEETMGKELRIVFDEATTSAVATPAIRIEMAPCWTEWTAMREFVDGLGNHGRRAITCGRTWVDAIKSGDVFHFLTAVRWAHRRTIMVGREDTASVAEAIGAKHVSCPSPNAYSHLDDVVERVRAAADGHPYLLLSSIGMASEPLLWRLWTGDQILIDWGHTPDAMMGLSPRNYLRKGGVAAGIRQQFLEWADSQ